MSVSDITVPTRLQPEIDRFATGYGFSFDDFQRRAVAALAAGRSVLVAAPTGAGKTVVGEFACHLAVSGSGDTAAGRRHKCFYTTPVKALSNQKFRDFAARWGEQQVGLLTGDRSINGDAPIVVMTTEVLRNMIYEGSRTLEGLGYVVLDEVHYLADRARGAVWEEVIIQVPAGVQLAALSATVSNAEEFGDWLTQVRDGGCDVVIEERRPVPLRHHYFVDDTVYPTFVTTKKGKAGKEEQERAARGQGGRPNPKVARLERQSRRRRGRRRLRWPSRPEIVEELADRGWLPAILFVFSRTGCDKAVDAVLRSGVTLTTSAERSAIHEIIGHAVGGIPDADLRALGFGRWQDTLMSGVAAHHAGMVPAFKEAVEQAFQDGLLKVVIATETLALGINMPAKSVVIERLEKFNGERHVQLTPGEYTQLTGRAGRRGIDPVGHAVVSYQRDIDFDAVASLVATRTYPLSSSFQPSYNMAVNLLRHHDLTAAERLLTASFAQFQTDRSVTGLTGRLDELETGMAGYADHLTCERGDWPAYWQLRRELTERQQQRDRRQRDVRNREIRERIDQLVPGEVVWWPAGPRRGLAAVVGSTTTRGGTPLARVVTEDRRLVRLGPREVDTPPPVVGQVDLPAGRNQRTAGYRGQVADLLQGLPDPDPVVLAGEGNGTTAADHDRISELQRRMETHPCHGCPQRDEHERWQGRYDRLADEATWLRTQVERRTGSLVRHLHRLLDVLRQLGYVDASLTPTNDGLRLAGIYADADLVIAECLAEGVTDGLGPAELAGLCALFTYESRGDEPVVMPELPSGRLSEAVTEALRVADRIRQLELSAGLTPLGELDPGFAAPAWRWARGDDLDRALGSLDMAGGDFVRNIKQVADLAGQLRDVAAERGLVRTAERTVHLLRRGIVEA